MAIDERRPGVGEPIIIEGNGVRGVGYREGEEPPEGPVQVAALGPITRQAARAAARAGKRVRHVTDIHQTSGNIPVLEMEQAVSRTEIGRIVDPARTDTRNFTLSYIDTAEDIKTFMDDTSIHLGTADGPRMGVQTHEETVAKAKEVDLSLSDLLDRKPDATLNAEQLVRARAMMVSGAEEIYADARRMLVYDPHTGNATLRGDISAEEEFAFRKKLATYAALQHQVQGAVKEAARALNAMKITVGNDILTNLDVAEKLEAMGGSKMTAGLAQLIVQTGGNPYQIGKVARQGWFRRTGNALQEVWINGLLSAPSTHAVNMIGNTITAAMAVPERYLAALGGGLRHAVTGSEDRVTTGEANAMMGGVMGGLVDGFRSFWRALVRSEDYTGSRELLDPSRVKLEHMHRPAVTAENFGLDETGLLGRAVDMLGKYYIRVPGRMLEAEDEFFKAIGYSMELHAGAHRKALSDGLTPGTPEFRAAYGSYLNDPPEDLAANAMLFARYQTFTNDLTDRGSRLVQQLSNVGPMKIFLPFVRTPTNIIKYGVARTPAGMVMPSVLKDLRAGGAARDLAVSRMALGSMVGMLGYMLASNYEEDPETGQPVHRPIITGAGPSSWSMRRVWEAAGIKPYSLYIDGKYVPYDRYEPFGMQLAVIASSYEVLNNIYDDRARDEAYGAMVMGLADYLMDKSFFQGFAQLLDLLQGQRNASSWSAGLAASMVPNWLNRARQDTDPYMRETRGGDWLHEWLNRTRNRLPGWFPMTEGSEGLPLRYDIWGKPMRYGEPLLFMHTVSPTQMHAAKNDPLTRHLIENRVPEKRPPEVITISRKDAAGLPVNYEIDIMQLDKSGRAYSDYTRMVGQERRRRIVELVKTQAFKDAPVGTARRNMIEREFDRARDAVNDEFVRKYDDGVKRQANLQDAQRTRGYRPTLPPHFDDGRMFR